MAFNVSYIFSAKDAFSAAANKIKRATKGIRKQFKKLPKDLDKANKKLKETERINRKVSGSFVSGFKRMALAAGAFFGLRAFFTVGSKFQDSIADLASITGAAGKELAFLREESLRLAKSSVTAQNEVATAFKVVASGKSELLADPKALSKVTEQVLLLKNAAGIDLANATSIVIESLNQFDAGAEQASRFVNVLAAGAKVGASEVGQTGAALLKASVAAKLAGVGFEELNAVIQVLAKSGQKTEIAGTGLQRIFINLEKTGVKKLMPSVVGLTSVLTTLKEANLNVTQQTTLFGEEGLKVGNILLNKVPLIKQFTKAITGTSIAEEQASIRLNTFNARMRALGISIKDKVIRVFEKLEPVITKQITAFSMFIDSITTEQVEAFGRSLKSLLQILLAIGKVLKIVVVAVRIIASIFKGVGTAIGEFAGQLATLNFGADLSTSFTDAFSIGDKFLGIFGNETKNVDVVFKTKDDIGIKLKEQIKNLDLPKVKGNVIPFPAVPKIKTPTIPPAITEVEKPQLLPPQVLNLNQQSTSRTDVNVNLKAPKNTIEKVDTRKSGNTKNLNVGLNVAVGQ